MRGTTVTRPPRSALLSGSVRRGCRIGGLLALLGGTVAGCVSAETMHETPLSAEALAPASLVVPEGGEAPRPDRAWRLRLNHL
jgi:hypothetical protein